MSASRYHDQQRLAHGGLKRFELSDGGWFVAQRLGGAIVDADPKTKWLIEFGRSVNWSLVEVGIPVTFTDATRTEQTLSTVMVLE